MAVDWRQGAVGAAAGFLEACVMHPIDTVKTRLQARAASDGTRFVGVADAFARTYGEEGVGAFYKGLGPVVVSVVPRVCVQYLGLGMFLPMVKQSGAVPAALQPSVAGVLTGVMQATLVVTPLELLKNRQQVQRGAAAGPRGLAAAARHVVRAEGVRGLYKGLAATIARQCWGLFIKFGSYIHLRDELHARYPSPDGSMHAGCPVLAGGCTNVLVGVLVSPVDVVKTRVQLSASDTLSIRACLRGIIRDEGWRVLFRGASMRVLRVAPGGALQFGTAEYLAKHVFGVKIGG
eukprot:TRINITY_DN925_c0_g6_i1.p1 TRINITY_DN925_c0_g6~~TRINITY_DN925_c0_g6_i1.p1  ORF type:complete len:327 (+),score=64.69 TRINITY_DN925_c0_g6_i1:109-981(+)